MPARFVRVWVAARPLVWAAHGSRRAAPANARAVPRSPWQVGAELVGRRAAHRLPGPWRVLTEAHVAGSRRQAPEEISAHITRNHGHQWRPASLPASSLSAPGGSQARLRREVNGAGIAAGSAGEALAGSGQVSSAPLKLGGRLWQLPAKGFGVRLPRANALLPGRGGAQAPRSTSRSVKSGAPR